MCIVTKRAYPGDEEKIGREFYYWDIACDQCGEVIGGSLDGGWAVFARGPEPERSQRSGDWKNPKAVPVHWVHERCWSDWLSARPAGETEDQFIREPAAEGLVELARVQIAMLTSRMYDAAYTKARGGGVCTRLRLKADQQPEPELG